MKSLAVLLVLAVAVLFVPAATAHELTFSNASTDCGGGCLAVSADLLTPGDHDKITYTFTLTSNTGGAPITVSGEIDFTVGSSGAYSNTVCFSWLSSGSLTDNYTVTGTVTLTTPVDTSSRMVDFGGGSTSSVVLTCGTTPQGKSFSMSNSMEGDLSNIQPGDWISGGYSFKFITSNHAATVYTVTTSVTLPVYCPDGGGSGGNIQIPLGTQTFNIAAGDTNWHRTGDQNSILSWEGAVRAPDLCGGHRMRNQIGATFNTRKESASSHRPKAVTYSCAAPCSNPRVRVRHRATAAKCARRSPCMVSVLGSIARSASRRGSQYCRSENLPA